ncbi:hypothetical protein GQ44DRAFT_718609 [Phaeosphaeriaceae sp. PMI808]|nr:hypothetical protein GQ44DRAFT_718609 [Phaeosphaeriaceae sp. PMI808]
MSMRICIRVCVHDIPGNPLERTSTLGKLFCQKVLQRQFQEALDVKGYDHGHIPPGFNSPNPLKVWFIFDLDVKSKLNKEQLSRVPHSVYLASLQKSGELEFIPRNNWKEAAQKRASIYVWGGPEEQRLVEAMREATKEYKLRN